MPLLYLAKVNLNSDIFEVYEKKLKFDDVFNLIIQSITGGIDFATKNREKYIDSYGNTEVYIRESQYTFQEIKKKEYGIITGKLVRTFNKPSEKLDVNSNRLIKEYVTESVSIYFYYDIFNEMITFCERQSFGYNQFMNAFTNLLNKCVGKYEFEIFLQKDRDLLEEKMKSLHTVQKIRATLIPPNSTEDDLQDLRNELTYMQQCQDANATKMNLDYVSDELRMESKVMKDILNAVSRGYGDVTAVGINGSGRTQTISSSLDAAYTANIQDNIGEEEYNEESKGLIIRYLAKLHKKIFS